MRIFNSAPKPPEQVQPPTCASPWLRGVTQGMTEITAAVNSINQATFQALGRARDLKNSTHLSGADREKIAEAKELLKFQSKRVANTAFELKCFNAGGFGRAAGKLAALHAQKSRDGTLPLNENKLYTPEGHTKPWLEQEVISHRGFAFDLSSKGVEDIQKAVRLFNEVANTQHIVPLEGLSELWVSTAALTRQ